MESFKKAQTKDNASSAVETTLLLNDVEQVIYGGRDDEVHRSEESLIETGQYKRSTPVGDNGFFKKLKKMYLFLPLLFLTVVYVVCVLTKPLMEPALDFGGINTLVSFGDSYTTRFLNMDNLEYACRNCTSARGPNWVIYLSEATNWVSWDFAYNSAPVNNSLVGQVPTVIDVRKQVQELYPQVFVSSSDKISAIVASKYKDNQVRTPKSTLTTIWVGINDIDITYNWRDIDQLDIKLMKQYENLIEELSKEGVSQFMIINVPPIDRAPMWHKTINEDTIKSRVKGYNKKLSKMVQSLKRNHPTDVFIEYDVWSLFHKILDNYKDHDLTDIDTFCPDWSNPVDRKCKPIGEYFWLNDLHPTFHVHNIIAQDIQRYLSGQ